MSWSTECCSPGWRGFEDRPDVNYVRGSARQPSSTAKPRSRATRKGLLLAESGEFEGFSTDDVMTGLSGVCEALDDLEYTRRMDIDLVAKLARAARVLSTILMNKRAI
jgi:hypothetical protein